MHISLLMNAMVYDLALLQLYSCIIHSAYSEKLITRSCYGTSYGDINSI